jgi:16S rRNA (guanine527-N7)-methyltransferase
VEHQQELREFLLKSAATIGFTLTATQIDQFMRYLQELVVWNKKINLTGIDKPRDVIVKHFVDSLAALKACSIPLKSALVDLGSGAGFPGIPLKIVREDLHLILIEPVHKKSSFLKSLIGLLKLKDAVTFDGTVQEYVRTPSKVLADFVVIRALKFEDVATCMTEILRPGGRVVLYRTELFKPIEFHKNVSLETEISLSLPYGYGDRVISVVEVRKAA